MSHVTEGALHAYLDGALDEYPAAEAERIRGHLDSCAACASRLVEERQIRSDASAMLGLAAPDVDMPSLEELRAYVKTTRPARPAVATRMYRLSWAASVMLALGAGWLVRDGQIQPLPVTESDFGDAAAPSIRSSDAEGIAGDGAGGSLDAGVPSEALAAENAVVIGGLSQEAALENAPAPVTPAALDDIGGRTEVMADATAKAMTTPLEEQVAVPTDPETDVVARADMDAAAEAWEAARAPLAQRGLAAVGPDVVDLVAVDSRLAGVGEGGGVPSDVVAAAPPLGRTSDSLAAGETAGASALAATEPEPVDSPRVERRRAEAFAPLTSEMNQGPAFAARRAIAEDEADYDNEASLVVLGYEVLSVTNMGDGVTPHGVHVVQRLEGDEVLELFHLQVGVDPAIVPVPEDGRNEVREEVDGAWIVIQGKLPHEELRVLLGSLFPEG